MDFGFVGTAVLLGYFAINVGKIIRLHRSHKCHQRYALTVSVIVCVLLHGLLDISMLWPQTGLLVIYIVGFSTEYDKQHIFGTDRRHEIFALHARSIQAKESHLVKNSVILYKKDAEISAVFFFCVSFRITRFLL